MTSSKPIVITLSDSDEEPNSYDRTSNVTATSTPENNIELIVINDTGDNSTTGNFKNAVTVHSPEKRKTLSFRKKELKRKKHRKNLTSTSYCRTSNATVTSTPENNTELIVINDAEDNSRTGNLKNAATVSSSQKRKRLSHRKKESKKKKRRKKLASTVTPNNILHLTDGQIPSSVQSHSSSTYSANEQKHERKGKKKEERNTRTDFPVPTISEDMETTRDPRVPKKWTEEMRKFYFDSIPGAANLNLEEVLAKKSNDNWHVGEIDRRRARSYYHANNFTCKNCNRIGHLTLHCNELSKRDEHRRRNICWMCSVEGHQPHQCSLRICFRCGNRGVTQFTDHCYLCNSIDMSKVQCERCSMWGHVSDNCTDNWRMYNFTVKPGKIIRGTAYEKPPSQLCCCNCAKWGHTSENCKKPKMNFYYDVSSSVVNYDYPMRKSQLASYLRQAQGSRLIP